MRLSEAILLGDSLKKATNSHWISEDGSCGCAFGGALLASGCTAKDFKDSWDRLNKSCWKLDSAHWPTISEMDIVQQRWPWITNNHLYTITRWYGKVMTGFMTIEQLADKVRELEDGITQKLSEIVVKEKEAVYV